MNQEIRHGTNETPGTAWWGSFPIETGDTIRWLLGGLELSVTRHAREWEFNYRYAGAERGQSADELWNKAPQVNRHSEKISAADNHARFTLAQTADQLTLMPIMPNRSMVSRPWDVLQIPSGEQTTLFVGAPLWLRIAFGAQQDHFLDIPIRRLSDTWFGPSSMKGELCYASRTHAFTDPALLVNRPYRALVPVHIRNRAESSLKLERINLPVTLLDLFRDNKGRFWSKGLTINREEGRKEVSIRIDPTVPDNAVDAELVSKAAQKSDENLLTQTLDMLFA